MAAACQLFGVGTKGIGQQDISPGCGIVAVDGCQHIRHFQRGQFRLLAGLQAALLQLGAHAAIEKDKAAAVKYFLNLHR